VPGLSALTSGSLSSSRRSPRDSRTFQPSRRVNPDLAWGSQSEDCLHRPGPELVGSDRSRRTRLIRLGAVSCQDRAGPSDDGHPSSTTFVPSAPLAEESLPKKRLSSGRVDPFRRRNLRFGLVSGRSLVQPAIPTLLLVNPDSRPRSRLEAGPLQALLCLVSAPYILKEADPLHTRRVGPSKR